LPIVARLLRLRPLQPAWALGYGLVADHRRWLVRLGAPRLLAALLARAPPPSPAARR
jgi:hypothetical protein